MIENLWKNKCMNDMVNENLIMNMNAYERRSYFLCELVNRKEF